MFLSYWKKQKNWDLRNTDAKQTQTGAALLLQLLTITPADNLPLVILITDSELL
jgi:hypothetical protein